MLSISHGLLDFAQKDMTNIRTHIALQLLRATVCIPEYNIPPKPYPTVTESSAIRSPTAPLTQEDLDAAQLLLGLATPEPERAVHFDHDVQVQEFQPMVRSVLVALFD
jgi:hypothetical protein